MATIQNKSKSLTLTLLLSVLLATNVQQTQGYAIAQPRTQPSTNLLTFPEIDIQLSIKKDILTSQNGANSAFQRRRITSPHEHTDRPSRVKYDLGLGKNQPVVSQAPTRSHSENLNPDNLCTSDALMYWNEYESVREFPSPLNRDEKYVLGTANPSSRTRSRKVTPITPARHVEDTLPIFPLEVHKSDRLDAAKGKPVMVRSDSSRMDVNTIWVEMLIHSEQLKYAAANAN